jgi:hypothetical protein
MITSKILPLVLLLVSPLALARVQLHTQAELKNSKDYCNHSMDITFEIDAHESLEAYNQGDLKIVAELLAEDEATATTRFSVYGKNASGEYNIISAPVIVASYAKPAMISLGSVDGESFTMEVQAQKV